MNSQQSRILSIDAQRNASSAAIRLAIVLLLAMAGCGPMSLSTQYGTRSGNGSGSVNGVSVLGDLFKRAGHRVRSWRVLSPSLEEADVIVWFPDDARSPSGETWAWLHSWLVYSEEEKTLVYVGRNYDAEVHYWTQTQAMAPTDRAKDYAKKLSEAIAKETRRQNAKPGSIECGKWFALETGAKKTKVNQLSGPWASGVDASKCEIEHSRNVVPDAAALKLLVDGAGHPLVSEVTFAASEVAWTDCDSRLIIIENGSFLLNESLVNHEHRKLAGKLVSQIGEPKKGVVFLESDANPPVRESDPSEQLPTGLELFGVWPIGAVLTQLAALGLVFALMRWPIFGVPRRLESSSLTDFGQHVEALARLLAGTRDRAYAIDQLKRYFIGSESD